MLTLCHLSLKSFSNIQSQLSIGQEEGAELIGHVAAQVNRVCPVMCV